MDQAADAVRSAMAEEPKSVAPALEAESPAPGPVTLLTTRLRSRRGREMLLGTGTAMAGVVLYLLLSHDGSLPRHLLAILAETATSPIGASGVHSALINPLPGNASTSVAAVPASAGTDADALMRRACIALDQARLTGGGVALFKGGLDRECAQRMSLMGDLSPAPQMKKPRRAPPIRTSPFSGVTSAAIIETVVVLPAPFGPSSPTS